MKNHYNIMNNKSMNIENGLQTYCQNQIEKRLETPKGRKVIYTGKNGYDIQHQNLPFKINDILTIKEIYVGRSTSTVKFIEFPDKEYNTVMFNDIEK